MSDEDYALLLAHREALGLGHLGAKRRVKRAHPT
jgi:hypothetical protein